MSYPVGVEPFDVAIGDVNGDGLPEIGCVNHQSNSVTILRNLGDGRFGPGWTLTEAYRPTGLAFVDIDNDGDLDVVDTNYYGNSITVWRNTGPGDLRYFYGLSTSRPVGGVRGANPEPRRSGSHHRESTKHERQPRPEPR